MFWKIWICNFLEIAMQMRKITEKQSKRELLNKKQTLCRGRGQCTRPKLPSGLEFITPCSDPTPGRILTCSQKINRIIQSSNAFYQSFDSWFCLSPQRYFSRTFSLISNYFQHLFKGSLKHHHLQRTDPPWEELWSIFLNLQEINRNKHLGSLP